MSDDDRNLRDRLIALEIKLEQVVSETKTVKSMIFAVVALVLVAVGKSLLSTLGLGG